MDKKIVVLGTGGTIAGTGPAGGVGYTAAQLGVQDLVAGVPGLAQAAGGSLCVEQVAQIDSKDMGVAVWQALVARCLVHLADPAVSGIVITHGTDTLEETAWLLHELLPADKPVVLTCAMRPATALAPDGPQNLLDAVALAAHADARGVLVVTDGTIHGAREVRKAHPHRLDAFVSSEGGPLGWVRAGAVRWAHGRPPEGVAPSHGDLAAALPASDWPRVEIVLSHAGTDGALVDWCVAAGVRGIVVAATGNGTLHHALQAALERAVAGGVVVCIATRCPLGRMDAIDDARWHDSAGQSPVKARISLMLELMAAERTRSKT